MRPGRIFFGISWPGYLIGLCLWVLPGAIIQAETANASGFTTGVPPVFQEQKQHVLEMSRQFRQTFIYYGSPKKLSQAQWKTLASQDALILNTSGDTKRVDWKKSDLEKLRHLARTLGNPHLLILSYVSLGAADQLEKPRFEQRILPVLKKAFPGKTEAELREMVWMNAVDFNANHENIRSPYSGAQINLSPPGILQVWQEFKEQALAAALKQNQGGGVFFDDSDAAQLYLDRFWKKNNEEFSKLSRSSVVGAACRDKMAPEMAKWISAVADFAVLYKNLAASYEEWRGSGPSSPRGLAASVWGTRPVIVQNRGFCLRDSRSYVRYNIADHAWEPVPERHQEIREMLNRVNTATVFENMEAGHIEFCERVLLEALSEHRPVIIVNYSGVSMPEPLLQKTINNVCQKAADQMFSAADLRQLVSLKYYEKRDFKHVP